MQNGMITTRLTRHHRLYFVPTSKILILPIKSGKTRGGGPRQQPAHPQYANYWAPLTRKRHAMPHSAQPQHTNYWALRTRIRHQQEHRPQRSAESSDPTQHAKGRTGDCPGPRKGTAARRNVTQGGAGCTNGHRDQEGCSHESKRGCRFQIPGFRG